MEKFYIRVNEDFEGWDVIEREGIESEEGNEDSHVATFYDQEKLIQYMLLLNK